MRTITVILMAALLALLPAMAAPAKTTPIKGTCGTCACCVSKQEAAPGSIPAVPPSVQTQFSILQAELPRAIAAAMTARILAFVSTDFPSALLTSRTPLFARFCSFLI